MGDLDQAVIKTTEPALLTWMDAVYPIPRSKLEKAASETPSYNFVDLSLIFTHEQAFVDLAHLRFETPEQSTAYELMSARMADEIVWVLYDGKDLPNWRETHVEETPHDWNEQAYLVANPDVARSIAEGKFHNGFDHYRSVGFLAVSRARTRPCSRA